MSAVLPASSLRTSSTGKAPAAASPERRLTVRLARDADDLRAVQKLRWTVFFAERGAGAVAQANDAAPLLDRDKYDDLCDHLLVIDEAADGAAPEPAKVVGTYRLLRESVARAHDGFYSAGEYDLSPLIGGASRPTGELLELGRSCVLPAYRTSATIALLWRGISEYMAANRIALMFGCASFAGTDPAVHASPLSWLHHHHLAPEAIRPRVHAGLGSRMDLLAPGQYDPRAAMLALPPLIKGYLRTGACFGDGAFIDHGFNTVDVCVVMPVARITARYAARFNVAS
ncbi:MAG: GNAT family N-acetyltransferase [Novosphingobium meiothermophilum]